MQHPSVRGDRSADCGGLRCHVVAVCEQNVHVAPMQLACVWCVVCGVRVCFCIGVPVCVAKESLATKRRSHTPTLRLTILGCCLNCSSCHDTQEQARALQVAVEAATDRFERGEGGAFCRMLCTSVLEAAV